MASDTLRIPLSPLHSIELAEGLRQLLNKPQEKDYSLHTIARKAGPDGRELVHMELVLAGRLTREAFPLAAKYPVHFLKSYHPWAFHGDPAIEFKNAQLASEILGCPEPIGCTSNSFRTAFIPAKPLARFSPFTDQEPHERCIAIAKETPQATLIGLWQLALDTFAQLEKLHAHRYFHRDMELHNVVVCTAPVRVFLIDFESSEPDFVGPDETFEERKHRDLEELLRFAVFVQCGLGPQEGALADACRARLDKLFQAPASFAPYIESGS